MGTAERGRGIDAAVAKARAEANLLDGGAPFYRTYECADGKFMAVGPLEPQFHAELVRLAGLPEEHLASQMDSAEWANRRDAYAEVFRQKTRDEWAERFLAPAGLTGLWQVTKRGKSDMSTEERINLDIEYARRHSIWFDLRLIWKTIPAMLQEENV